MGKHSVHTNIALDYPTIWTGMIYSYENFKIILTRDDFIERVVSGELVGTYNFTRANQELSPDAISHTVLDAYISPDNEVMFDIQTNDNQLGSELDRALINEPTTHLAKMVIITPDLRPANGIVIVKDLQYVHINRIKQN